VSREDGEMISFASLDIHKRGSSITGCAGPAYGYYRQDRGQRMRLIKLLIARYRLKFER
jgi:hypothetical protein